MLFIDVSEYQGEINWKEVAKRFKAAYLKASEGTTWVDPDFGKNRKAANAAGVHVGAYHFARYDNPVAEAKHFASVVQHVAKADLKPVLDLETKVPEGYNGAVWARHFNAAVIKELGQIPMFYSYAPYIEELKASKPIGNGLWLAAYGRNDGKEYPVFTPLPWKRFVAHQFTSNGTVPGIKGKVDVSDAKKGLRSLLAHPIKAIPAVVAYHNLRDKLV